MPLAPGDPNIVPPPPPPWMSTTWYVVNRTPFGDFTDPLEDMMIAYLKANWAANVNPYISINPPYDFKDKVRFGDFPYDYNATYYVRVKEDDTDFNNDLVLDNTYQMRTALNIDLSARRLRYGENFAELNNMRLEVMRILGIYRPDNMSGIHMITMDLPGERDIESQTFGGGKTIWYLRIKCWLHYIKSYTCV